MISDFIPDSLSCLFTTTDSEKNTAKELMEKGGRFVVFLCTVLNSKANEVNRNLSITYSKLLIMPQFYTSKDSSLSSLRFFPLSDIIPSLLSMPPFLYFFQKILPLFSSYITEDCTEGPADKIAQGNRGLREVNKRILFTARGRLHTFWGETKEPSILCCP